MDITNVLKTVIIIDADGKSVLSRHFDSKINLKQFERKLFLKTKNLQRTKDGILILDGMLVLHRFITDLHVYVVGNRSENPMILDSVLSCLVEVLNSLLNKNVERQSINDHMSQIILALDEICDNGEILETDSNLVLQRVSLKDDLIEPTMAQKLQSAYVSGSIKFPWIRS